MHNLAYGSACKFAYITRWPKGVAGNRVLLYMQYTAQHKVIKLVEHTPVAKDYIEPGAVSTQWKTNCAKLILTNRA